MGWNGPKSLRNETGRAGPENKPNGQNRAENKPNGMGRAENLKNSLSMFDQ